MSVSRKGCRRTLIWSSTFLNLPLIFMTFDKSAFPYTLRKRGGRGREREGGRGGRGGGKEEEEEEGGAREGMSDPGRKETGYGGRGLGGG